MAARSRVGDVLASKYRLEALLGSGGMGDVYRAVNEDIGRAVAIKLLRAEHTEDSGLVERFLREARAANLVRHPNVVDVLDIGRDAEGSPFIVQELLHGQDLSQYAEMRGGKLTLSEIQEYFLPVVDAVAEAHARGVVHRDIKPENVFLAEVGDRVVPKLLDFGISKIRMPDVRVTDVGVLMGTPAYMAPEQVLGQREADPKSDVWALGIMLFELLAGRLPFPNMEAPQLFVAIATTEVPRLIEICPEVAEDVSRLAERCVRRTPEERYHSARELARDHRHVLEGTEIEPTGRFAAVRANAGSVPSLPSAAASTRAVHDTELSPRLFPPAPGVAAPSSPRLDAPALPAPAPSALRKLVPIIAVGSLVIGGLAAAVVILLGRRADDSDRQFVVIDRNAPGASASSATTSPVSSGAASPSSPAVVTSTSISTAPSAAGVAAVARPAVKQAGDPLSAALAKSQPEIEACFRSSGGTDSDVSVRFSIDVEGVVQRAEVTPPELASAPLGQCILGIARRTRFPAQAAPATFRIPLRSRKVP